MKALPLSILFCCVSLLTYSQNLIPNPGFEKCKSLPESTGQFGLLEDWFNPLAGTSPVKPDYFHASALKSSVSFPLVWGEGMRVEAFDGNGAIGLYTYPSPVEFVSVKLTDPLIEGEQYKVSFYYTQGGTKPYGGQATKIGMLFTANAEILTEGVLPQVTTPSTLFSTKWQKFTAVFTAQEALQYLTIGNFWPDDHRSIGYPEAIAKDKGYIFIDQVKVVQIHQGQKAIRVPELASDINTLPQVILSADISNQQSVRLKKMASTPTLEGRSVVAGKSEVVDTDMLKIKIYDAKHVDGDVVSIYYNGRWLIRKKALRKRPIVIKVPILPHHPNVLVLHADNLGTTPPNTATLEYSINGTKHVVNLNSGLTQSEAITFESL